MPLDAIFLHALTQELKGELLGVRIDKVQQPTREQIVLLLRGSKRLLINAGTNQPRLQLTAELRENPAEPPMFCMLLRKHLVGGRILSIEQPDLERVVLLHIESTNELGQSGRRTLVLEAMGRRSNLILLDGEGRIVDCMRRVDAEMSPQRQVLPGLYYELPPATDRLAITEETEEGFREKLARANSEQRADSFLLDHYFGLAPLMARELVYRAAGDTDRRLFGLSGEEETALWKGIAQFASDVQETQFTPFCLKKDGRPTEFFCHAVFSWSADG